MSKFSERLRLLRNAKGLSQADFAKQIKISKSSVNMYERGEREPNFTTLEVIADYFNVDMDYLLGKSDIENRSQNSLPLALDNPQFDGSEIMFALSRGGEKEITEEMFDEVKRFAAYVAQRNADKK